MKKFTAFDIIINIIAILPLIVAIILYSHMPDTIPIHYGINGAVDRVASREMVFFVPTIIVLCLLPINFMSKSNKNLTRKVQLIVTLFLTAISFSILYLQYNNVQNIETHGFSFSDFIFVALGLTLIFAGNLMPKARQNYHVGVRTRTTLHDKEIWEKTNRLTGKLFVLCGAVLIIGGIFLPYNIKMPVVLITIAVICVVPLVYPLYLKHTK